MMPQIYTGARATIQINGETVEAGFVASWNIDTSATEIETLDNVFPAELAPERIRVSMSLKVYRTPDNDPSKSKFVASIGDINKPEQDAFTQAKYLTVNVKDSLDQTIFYVPKAWLVRRSASVSIGDFLVETWAITGIGYYGPPVSS